ncbi:CD3337/EF1877 family mobilome membrane protein [Listeria monocytogenes]
MLRILKKNRWILITVLLCAVIFFIFPFNSGIAEDGQNTVDANSIKKGGIELLSKKYDLSHYESLTSTEDEGMLNSAFVGGMNAIANFFFAITKLIGEVIDTGIGYLYSLDAIKLLSEKIGGISELLWDNLYASFGILFFLVAVLQIFFTVVVKKNGVAAGKKAFMLFLVIGISFIWFSNSSWYLKSINKLSSETQGVIMKAGTAFSADSGQKITKGQELDGSLAVMRNAYFSIVVEKPYLLMNYGTPDKSQILKDDSSRIDRMLSFKMTQAGLESKKKVVESEINDLGNNAMNASNVSNKMGVSFLSMIFAILLGIPLLLIAFLNLLLQVLALGIALLLPISFIVSFIPSFANSGWKTFGKLVGVFLLKALVGMVILFVFLIITIMDTIIPTTNTGMYFLNGIAIAVCIILLIIFRDKMITLVTAGMVSSLDNHITDNSAGYLKNKLRGMGFSSSKEIPENDPEDNPEDEPETESTDIDSSDVREDRTEQDSLENNASEIDMVEKNNIEEDDVESSNIDGVKQNTSTDNDSDIDVPDSMTDDENKEDLASENTELDEIPANRENDYEFARDNRIHQELPSESEMEPEDNENEDNLDFKEQQPNSLDVQEQEIEMRIPQEGANNEEGDNEDIKDRIIINDWDKRNEGEYEESDND